MITHESVSLQSISEALQGGRLEEARALIQAGIQQGLKFDGKHVLCAHVLLEAAPWEDITKLLPVNTNSLESTGWLNSVKSGRPVNKVGKPIPWFTYPAIDFIETVLDPEWEVFEWGSGNSTLWWAEKCKSVYAVESDAAWYREVSRSLPSNATIRQRSDQEAYVREILDVCRDGRRFDVIVIDGLYRSDCAEVCKECLKPNGIIVFDNSDEEKHRRGVSYLNASGMFRVDYYGLIPSYTYRNCTSIFFNNSDILKNLPLPQDHDSHLGPSCGQAIDSLHGHRKYNTIAVKSKNRQKRSAEKSVLFSSQNPVDYMAPPQLSDNQVICGPFVGDCVEEGAVKGLKTVAGEYDIVEVVNRLPDWQKPDLLVVKADAARNNFPRNISALGIPTVLILGDTMHLKHPLRTMLAYAKAEKFDLYVTDHKRHHLHWFEALGVGATAWTPGLFVKDFGLGFTASRNDTVSFVGQAGGQYHPYRNQMLEALAQRMGNLKVVRAPQHEAAKIYNSALASLNFSLNGDLNLRVFEVLAAAGCLVTDRLSPQSGLDLLFRDGSDFLSYTSLEELVTILDDLKRSPARAIEIARSGHQAFTAAHTPDQKRADFLQSISAGKGWGSFDLPLDPRGRVFAERKKTDLFRRVCIYEWFQEMHRRNQSLDILFQPECDPAYACDLVDLPRHKVRVSDDADRTLFAAAGVADQIAYQAPGTHSQADVLVYPTAGFTEFPDSKFVLVQEWGKEARFEVFSTAMRQFGYNGVPELDGLFVKA